MNNSDKTIIELAGVLSTCRSKADKTYVKALIDKVYDRDNKDNKKSLIEDLAAKVDSLEAKYSFSSD